VRGVFDAAARGSRSRNRFADIRIDVDNAGAIGNVTNQASILLVRTMLVYLAGKRDQQQHDERKNCQGAGSKQGSAASERHSI